MPPPLREIACEAVGTAIDRAKGIELLRNLAGELQEEDLLHGFIDHAIAAFTGGVDAGATDAPSDLAQVAFDIFCAARSPDEIAPLAREHRVFHDPEFVSRPRPLPQVPPTERELYRAKLARLRGLPPDKEVIGLRMFAQANSLDAVRAAVARYPFLASPEYYPKIARIIAKSTDADSRPALERRLGWLRAIRPIRRHEALQAFIHANTDEGLRDAVARFPQLAEHNFSRLAEHVLRDSPDWPALARRLKTLATLVPTDTDDLLESASRALAEGEPEQSLRFLDRLGEQAPGRGVGSGPGLISTHKEEEAIELLNEMIAGARSATFYAARGRAFCQLRQFREARADFTEALELDPDNFEARLADGA